MLNVPMLSVLAIHNVANLSVVRANSKLGRTTIPQQKVQGILKATSRVENLAKASYCLPKLSTF